MSIHPPRYSKRLSRHPVYSKVPLSPLLKQYLAQQDEEYEEHSFVLQSPASNPGSSIFESRDYSPFDQGYVTDQIGVASDVMTFLHQFYKNFPEKRKGGLYIASESYGGCVHHHLAQRLTNRKICAQHCHSDTRL